jgi:hypothetical protein
VLVFQEVIDPLEPAADRLLDYHADNYYLRNAAFSQLYYSRHAWLAECNRIELENISTYFGSATLRVISHADEGLMEAEVTLPDNGNLKAITICLPHPQGKKMQRVSGAECRIADDALVIEKFSNNLRLRIEY